MDCFVFKDVSYFLEMTVSCEMLAKGYDPPPCLPTLSQQPDTVIRIRDRVPEHPPGEAHQ
jgi:hypothetical protein